MNTMHILQTLKEVKDPELGLNIVDMGLIYGVDLQTNEGRKGIHIRMTLSSQGCPMGASITESVKSILDSRYPDFASTVELVWDPAWSVDLISDEGRNFLELN